MIWKVDSNDPFDEQQTKAANKRKKSKARFRLSSETRTTYTAIIRSEFT